VTLTPITPLLPERIGRYRVLERIGKGAMGSVYAALDEQLGRKVAIKLMLAAFEEETELRERFYREARITGQLAHRNIVTIFDLGEYNNRPYIVMELLDGLPLNEYLRADAVPSLDTKLDLMVQVCDGLQNAHQAGVIHRDIKPSNLFVLTDGTLRVLDFGVARLSASNLTAAGMLLGTPEYMSPEQARGQRMDARADVFSAAGVFYYMLAGRPPFGSRDLRNVLHAIINEDPPPLSDEEAPETLRHVLAKALAKNPEDRYQRCADLRAEIDRVRRTLAVTTARVMQAARDRCAQILALVEERRALGRTLALPDIDALCDEAVLRIQVRFPAFADPSAPAPVMDGAAAKAALQSLQARYNTEQAALAALQQRAIDHTAPPPAQRQGFWRGLLKARGN
jgi:tRNA A-37 threonylcarbamoyl transferase component Bud32